MNEGRPAGVPAPGRGPVIRSFTPRRDALPMAMLVFWTLFLTAMVILGRWVPMPRLIRMVLVIGFIGIWYDLATALCWTRYEVTADAIVIRRGLYRSALRFGAIQEVRRVQRPFPAPGRATVGLRIQRRRPAGSLEIAPADREEFMHVLSRACRELHWHGDRLVREEAGVPTSSPGGVS